MKKQTLYRALPIAVLAVTMQSCIVSKNYERPEVTNEAQFRTDNISQDTLSMANMSWKELFSDQTLIQYIEHGLENNLDIRIALENINAAHAYMQQGKWGYAPTLNLGANYTHSVLSKNGPQGIAFGDTRVKNDMYDVTGQFSWELDVWGKIRSDKRAAGASYLQTLSAHQAVKTQLISTIATTYFQLVALDEQKRVTEQTIVNRTNSLETIEALKESGQVNEVAVKQTQAQLFNAKALLVDLENNIKLTENAFSILLGNNPGTITRGELKSQKLNADLSVGVPLQLLSNRPDVRAAEYGLINAFEMTNVSRANFYPAFRLTANGGLQSLDFDNLFNTSSLFANFIGGLTQPLLNGRKVRTAHEVAKAKQESAYLSYKLSILNASKEVSDALYTYHSSSDKLKLKKQEYEAYNLATEYSEELLVQGMANYLDVLTARESALAAELSYINTELAQLTSIVQLYRAVGGGIK
ncbi:MULTISPECIES: efflux transporter outer membrane subunit [Myroides]|uniref:Efflux transporter, outer membrane factor (OMF) lipoprotein, NodT family n=1 Tax=Myroides profundi TaxID=480520 RepID=A0AAJ4W755_MYRPR|nr:MULTISPECIES: efflux transporter outer membrane subunit [Myroides]AJH16476.1 membrane protein [Myroides profundi]MEC4051425.1 efflux transporter outer membrane subunit [Myroides odoratimimus]SER68166.1 efflux transporter, outer membrane factor (OMF) lipoprotein, NodT family [Myroides profundi]